VKFQLSIGNIFQSIPKNLETESFDELLNSGSVKIERILSQGHFSPKSGWYDQEENEWVIVLHGKGCLLFEDGSSIELKAGDYINIPAHKRHKVTWTDPDDVTVWLAVFYR